MGLDIAQPEGAVQLSPDQQQQIADNSRNDDLCLQRLREGRMLVADLKDELRARQMQVSGNKATLMHRLECYLTQTDLPPPVATPKPKRKAIELDQVYDDPALAANYQELGNGLAIDAGPSKRGAGEGENDAPIIVERRLYPWRAQAPADLKGRLDRALKQRFFLLDRTRRGDELREEFKVLGSTGNVYTITIDQRPRCSCPDMIKNSVCKHMMFVWLKVIGLDHNTSPYWFQRALLLSELAQIFASARPAPQDVAGDAVRKAYRKATGQDDGDEEPHKAGAVERKPVGEDCMICYEETTAQELAGGKLWWCKNICGQNLHDQCFKEWQGAALQQGKTPTCPWCRTEIVDHVAQAARGQRDPNAVYDSGYLNLAQEAGISGRRDTSSYYRGPRRGMSMWEAREMEYGYEDDY